MTTFCASHPRIHCATSQVISPAENTHPPNIPSTAALPSHAVLNITTPSTVSDLSSFPALAPGPQPIHLSEESSVRDAPDATPIIRSSRRSSPVAVDEHNSSATSLNPTKGPIDTAIISPTAKSDSDPLPTAAVSISTHHPLFVPSSSNTVDLQNDTDLGIVPVIPLSSSLASVPRDTLPANLHSSLSSPASRTGQVTPGPGLIPSTSEAAISPTAPQGTSISHPSMAPNDGTFDTHHNSRVPDISNNVETPQRSHQLAMSIPDITTDPSCHPLDTAPSSHDIGRPE
jgi:hypothetical protein